MDQEFDARKLLDELKANYRVILIFTIVSTLIGMGLTFFLLQPIYQSKTDLLVNRTNPTEEGLRVSSNDIETNLRLIETYRFMIESPRIMDLVAAEIGNGMTSEKLIKKTNVTTFENSQIISIVVEDTNPVTGSKIANSVADTFQTEIKKVMNTDNVHILSKAVVLPDQKPVRPKPILNGAISVLIGLILGCTFILTKKYFNAKLHSEPIVEKLLSVTVLAVIPYFEKSKEEVAASIDQPYVNLIHKGSNLSPIAEAYRTLRTSLQFHSTDSDTTALMVTSTNSGEGKSLTSANLAIIFAMDNQKTIYIDGDLRRPNGHTIFEQTKRHGMTSYLTGYASLNDVISTTEIPNLSFIGSGPIPPNPSELLSSKNMDQLLNDLKEEYDVIIIDSPPLIVSDPIILSSKVNDCLFVVDAQNSKYNQTSKSLSKIQRMGGNIVGVVLNKDKSINQSQYYYY
ncbi:polysaccharide biosynthesis tyrosine autokinase [Pseudalkalibacillus berkeleyi]|uniref:non-specific protein-tyrosine kinase n=1 Tax=Pseudalkalibacillus berkeleyi TaxID=1069813 RepID=A0ABS9H470_9BACL|nr:polysaccharide biosynthesis tyrosine autokinase [Pseudalkalibacillus berkeleyi]MCF6138734.1 polysaccharide biosynthesis tyrosine autokinase [Pseudalkalibacillus berkeleyi]